MEEIRRKQEIDIIALVSLILKNWKPLIWCVSIASAIGVIVALNSPKRYKAQVLLAPELSSGGLGLSSNLADMASNFGFDIGSKTSMDAIYPELYPDVFSSSDFLLKLYEVPVRLKDSDSIRTYVHHLTKEQKSPFWDVAKENVKGLFKKKEEKGKDLNDIFKISKNDNDICTGIKNSILCTIDKKTSVISISVEDQDPLVAAIIADTLQSRLQQYITEYRTKKARTDVAYYTTLVTRAKEEYEVSRKKYVEFADANSEVILESYKSEMEDMENDMQLKFNSYSSLNTQLQAAKAKVQERTPAFTILQRPLMPYKASSTPRSIIVMAFVLIGVVVDALWVMRKEIFNKRQKKG